MNDMLLRVEDLTMAYGRKLIQRDLNFDVRRGEVLVIVGGSGCGKSTLLRHMIGLQVPAKGRVLYTGPQGDQDIATVSPEAQAQLRQRFGVMFQAGALFSSMTVGENVMLPMELFPGAHDAGSAEQRHQRAEEKLALVGLSDQFDAEPSSLSGGQRKRAAIARAMALDPPLLYLDEPSAGLDPITSDQLDQLIRQLRDEHQRSIVMVSHELASIFAVADRALFLDAQDKTMTALGPPRELLEHGPERVQTFLRRGKAA
ncbi:ATP-binding cassette domain-containing protein [Ideonella azotifigens]|uniref:ATP-binding cassette domain-containing protein n=2 Tax=Ideonella azotifigens TaxID=513160 RepID=A0ABN1KKF3_9BURK|nr:ATP-binding cassette domain-containing protein [Ideonella azotifigens]MCD2339333.1 ATP-binding cassette domain-containing protein [Ideonella azotifigens]